MIESTFCWINEIILRKKQEMRMDRHAHELKCVPILEQFYEKVDALKVKKS